MAERCRASFVRTAARGARPALPAFCESGFPPTRGREMGSATPRCELASRRGGKSVGRRMRGAFLFGGARCVRLAERYLVATLTVRSVNEGLAGRSHRSEDRKLGSAAN